MSLPPRPLLGEFPAAAVGPSIETPLSSAILQSLALSRKNKDLKPKRNAPLLMAGQRQLDIRAPKNTSPSIPTRDPDDTPHLLFTQGRSLQADDAKSKRYSSVTSSPEVLKKKKMMQLQSEDHAYLSPQKQRVLALLDPKNQSAGKQRESLLIAYWEEMEEKRLKQESLSVKPVSSVSMQHALVERLRQRAQSKEEDRRDNDDDKPEDCYLKVLPLQMEEGAVRRKQQYEQNRADTIKQMQLRRVSQRRVNGSLSIDSKFTSSLNISALQTTHNHHTGRSTTSGRTEGLLPSVSRLHGSFSEKQVHKSLELKRENQFKNMMASLADQIEHFGIRAEDQPQQKHSFASVIQANLQLTSQQKEHLEALRKREQIQEEEAKFRLREELEARSLIERKANSPQFIPIKLSHGTHYTVQKQLAHFNNTFSTQQNFKMLAKDTRAGYARKLMMAGLNTQMLREPQPQFSDLINISSLDAGALSPLHQTPSQETPPLHKHFDRRLVHHTRQPLKRLGAAGTQLVQGGALQVGGNTLQPHGGALGIGGLRITNPVLQEVRAKQAPQERSRGGRMAQLQKFQELQKLFDQQNLQDQEMGGLEQILQVRKSRESSPVTLEASVAPRLESYSKAKRQQLRTKVLFDEAMAALQQQDMIDNAAQSPSPKPLITIVNSMHVTPTHVRSCSKNFRDSLMKLRETAGREHESERKVGAIPDLAVQNCRIQETKGSTNKVGNRYKILNKPPVRFSSRQLSPGRKKPVAGSPKVGGTKPRYKFPETGFGKAVDAINHQCMRFQMNPLEFEKDLLINLNQTPAPEPTAAMVERLLHREPDDPSDSVTTDVYPREPPVTEDFQPRNREYTHLRNQKLNVILRLANVFSAHVFKRKQGNPDINFVLKLSKVLGLKLTRPQLTKEPTIFKSNKEFAVMVRDRLTAAVHQAINESNGVIPERSPGHVKFYVNRGNNGMLVRSILKKRYWWTMVDRQNVEECNVIWTQWRKNKIIHRLKHCPQPELRLLRDSVSESTTTATTATDRKVSRRLLRNTSSSDGEELRVRLKEKGLEKGEQEGKEVKQGGQKKKAREIIPEDAPPAIEIKIPHPTVYQSSAVKIYNRLEDNFHISNKKAMFINLRNYYEALGRDVFQAVPVTFHIQHGVGDPEFQRFRDFYHGEDGRCKELESLLNAHKHARRKQLQQQVTDSGSDSAQEAPASPKRRLKSRKNIWIVKPGENSNRGQGIHVCRSVQEIEALLNNYYQSKRGHTVIVQQYIDRPLLIHKRKFDIRCYALVTSINGLTKGFAYNEGYIRTSSREFKLKNFKDKIIHLTNDAVQKKSEDYGKFEAANKISYAEFQKYLESTFPEKGISFYRHINTQIKRLITDTIRSVFGKMDPNKRLHCFEIFGYDFMVDEDFNVQLIEVNTNPDISLCCPLLAMLIPTMLDNAFRIAIDPLFPPPEPSAATVNRSKHGEMVLENKFQLVFDERYDGQEIRELMKDRKVEIMDEESCEEDSSEDEGVPEDDE